MAARRRARAGLVKRPYRLGVLAALLGASIGGCGQGPASAGDVAGAAPGALCDGGPCDALVSPPGDLDASAALPPPPDSADAALDASPAPLDAAPPIDTPSADADAGAAPDDATSASPEPDGATDAALADTSPDVAAVPPFDPAACDAGDVAWVERTVVFLLGRRPSGWAEVSVLARAVQLVGREAVARAMMSTPEFVERWAEWWMDALHVNRVGDKTHDECYGPPTQPDDSVAASAWIRTRTPLAAATGSLGGFNMTDVLRASLRLDDISPVYRAHLFAMMAKPLTGANVDAIQMDLARRRDFGQIFAAVYTHRNVVCAGCHNATYSTTDAADPSEDRFWPLPGRLEAAVFGQDGGRPEDEVNAVFRRLGVFDETGVRPWGMDASCGSFAPPETIAPDPVDVEGYFVAPRGTTANVWQVEAALAAGFDKLRAKGLQVDPVTLGVDAEAGFAYLVCARIVEQLWTEAFGYPLTLVHGHPRNEAQRDALVALTDAFVDAGFSPRTVMLSIVMDPLFNQRAPAHECGPGHAYGLPPVFNPWILDEPDPVMHGNSVGDAVHRLGARVLLRSVEYAFGWPVHPQFPGPGEEAFQKAIGAFVKDAEPGFAGVDFQGLLAWEQRYGAALLGAGPADAAAADPDASCVGHCGGQAPAGCWCDAACVDYGDCCADKATACDGASLPPPEPDWFDALAQVVAAHLAAGQVVSVRDVAIAVKDRVVTRPWLEPDEEPLVAALWGVDNLHIPVTAVPDWTEGAHRFAGALLESPDFLLAGLPLEPPDAPTLPKLLGEDWGPEARCAAWLPYLRKAAGGALSCQPDAPGSLLDSLP